MGKIGEKLGLLIKKGLEMSKFLKLNFVKENFIMRKTGKTSKLEHMSDGYEHLEMYFNADLITHFIECEDIPCDGSSRCDDDFSEILETGTILWLSDDGVKAVDEICERLYDANITSEYSTSKGANFVLVANTVEDILAQLEC